jgi:hypothetical protein
VPITKETRNKEHIYRPETGVKVAEQFFEEFWVWTNGPTRLVSVFIPLKTIQMADVQGCHIDHNQPPNLRWKSLGNGERTVTKCKVSFHGL